MAMITKEFSPPKGAKRRDRTGRYRGGHARTHQEDRSKAEQVERSVVPPRKRARSARRRHGKRTLKVGLIGYGYWGPNLLRNFANASGISFFQPRSIS